MSVKKLDKKIWDYILSIIKNPEKLKRDVEYYYQDNVEKETENRKMLNMLMKEKEKIKASKKRVLDLYVIGSTMKDELNEKIEELSYKEESLDNEIEKVEDKLQKINHKKEQDKEIEAICKKYIKYIDNANFETRKTIVRRFIKSINILDGGAVRVNGFYLDEPVTIITKDNKILEGKDAELAQKWSKKLGAMRLQPTHKACCVLPDTLVKLEFEATIPA